MITKSLARSYQNQDKPRQKPKQDETKTKQDEIKQTLKLTQNCIKLRKY